MIVTLVLFTVDETGGTFGMTVGETADLLMRDYHVVDAINLDGDGSTVAHRDVQRAGIGAVVRTGRAHDRAGGGGLRGVGASVLRLR